MVLLITILLVLTTSVARSAQSPSFLASVEAIEGLCEKASAFAKKSESTVRIFADVSDPYDRSSREEWREFKNAPELQRANKESQLCTEAFVWGTEDFAFVSMFFTSPSGDWAHYVDYCFRQDGSLARSESTLNTFNVHHPEDDNAGPVSRIRTKHFENTGPSIRTQSKVIDLKSKKPAPKVSLMDQDEPIFRNIRELPFIALLK